MVSVATEGLVPALRERLSDMGVKGVREGDRVPTVFAQSVRHANSCGEGLLQETERAHYVVFGYGANLFVN